MIINLNLESQRIVQNTMEPINLKASCSMFHVYLLYFTFFKTSKGQLCGQLRDINVNYYYYYYYYYHDHNTVVLLIYNMVFLYYEQAKISFLSKQPISMLV